MRPAIHAEIERIKAIRRLAPSGGSGIEQGNHFARYFCVLSCGLLESSVRLIVEDFATTSSRPEIARLVAHYVKRFTDPKKDDLISLAYILKRDWGDVTKDFLNGENGDAINSVQAIRNLVAHGQNSGITLGTIDRYHVEIERTVEFLDNLIV